MVRTNLMSDQQTYVTGGISVLYNYFFCFVNSIVKGDFTAKIGNEDPIRRCLGKYAMKITNTNGEKAIEFADACNLKVRVQ